MSKVMDSVAKHFNPYLSANPQAGSDLASVLESEHTQTTFTRISVYENGQKSTSIKSEAFRYNHNVFALLLHNTDVAKSLLISRFVQNEVIDSRRSWYKRCYDALKTMRYEGGNGVTH